MPIFCYLSNIEGIDLPVQSFDFETLDAAIQQGCDLLLGPSYVLKAEFASCTIYAGKDTDRAPLGAWTCSIAAPFPEWLPEE